jgi:hypothetical protein
MVCPRFPICLIKHVLIFFHEFVYLLLMCRESLCRGRGCDHDLMFTLKVNYEEEKFPRLG